MTIGRFQRDTLMTSEMWRTIRFFSPEEKWGAPDRMKYGIIYRLNRLRGYLPGWAGKDVKIIVHSGYRAGSTGRHGTGEAVDCHATGISLMDFYIVASAFGFGGIGVYPWWKSPGLHLDDRRTYRAAQWGCEKYKKYVPLNEKFFSNYVLKQRR